MGFDRSDLAPAASKPSPAVSASVITPPPVSPAPNQTAIHFSGAFSLTLEPGTDFGPRYRIESLLGEGGMGTVYKAVDKELGRTVALKLVRPEYAASPAAMARFRQELLLASKISHKNILRIHDLGDAGGMKFITMAFVDGQDLGRLMERGRLPFDRILSFTRQLCSALDAAHSEEVVHRDLKPNNILVDKSDTVFVMDFGLAKSFENDATMMTRTGQILGTPRYMAPEQVEAKPVDHRADIYSFGLILYEMLAGDIPFRADSAMQLMYQRVTQPAKDIREANPEVPEYLANIVMRCIAREPEARYQSAHQILADIDAQSAPVVKDTAPVGSATIASGMSAIRTAPSAPAVGAQTISIQIPKPTRRGWQLVAGVLILLAGLAWGIPGSRHWILARFGGPSKPSGPTVRIAVLPFRVAGGAEKTQYVADGVVDSVSAKLSALSDIYVPSGNAVNSALATKKDPAKIAQALGVTLLVQGQLQTSGNMIAITVSLDDFGKNPRPPFQREFKGEDVLNLEDNIFDGLVNALSVKPSTEESARTALRPTQDVGAYDLYLKGRNLWRSSQDAKATQSAIDLFTQAVKADSRFPLAFAGLADAELKMWSQTKDAGWTEKALEAAQRAQAINDNLPEVHIVMGSVDTATGNNAAAVSELKSAIALAPNSDEAWRRLGEAYMAQKMNKEGIAAYEKAIEINPYLWTNFNSLGVKYFSLGDNDKALENFKEVTKLEPERANGYINVGAVYFRKGDWNEAIPWFQKAIERQKSPLSYSNLATTYFFSGQYNIAAQQFEEAAKLSLNDASIRANLGDAYRWSSQREKADSAYNEAIRLGSNLLRVNHQDTEALGVIAIAYAKKGDPKQGLNFIEQARAVDPKANSLMYKEATIYALAGDNASAMKSLGEALRNGYSLKEAMSDPELKALRETPEFDRLRKELSAKGK